jgi:hypothetical protein
MRSRIISTPGAPTAIAFNNPKLRKSCMESRTF